MLLDLIEEPLVKKREQLGPQNIFFSNMKHCRFIDTARTHLIPELPSDHEKADTKLVALAHAAQISWSECHDWILLWRYRHPCFISIAFG